MRCKIIITLFALVLFSVLIFPIVSFSSGETASITSYPLSQQQPPAADAASAQIYQEKCATCHDKPVGRVPSRSAIALGSTEEIIQTMTTGSMKQFADGLTPRSDSRPHNLSHCGTGGRARSGKASCEPLQEYGWANHARRSELEWLGA